MRRTMTLVLLTACLCACETAAIDPAQRQRELDLQHREDAGNGMTVGTPKVYDDSVLQQLLNAAQARLASLQVLDQTSFSAHLGSVTGARQDITSVAFSALGAPSPQVVTTA